MTKWIPTTARAVALAIPATVAISLQALAALPPEHQRVREFAAILDDGGVVRSLRYEPIESLEYVAPDLYRVTAGSCSVDVRIVSDPAPESEEGWVGPRPFHVEVGEAVCE